MRPSSKGRRALLLGGTATLLAGCETLSDLTDSILGKKKIPLPGERLPILAAERVLEVDQGGSPVTLPAQEAIESWPLAGRNLTHQQGHPALPQPLVQRWSTSIGTSGGYRRRLTSPPVIAPDGTGFGMDAFGVVTAMDLDRGRARWTFDPRPRRDRDGALGGGCAFDDGTLYVVTGVAEVIALNAADGTERWRVSIPAPGRGAPTIAAGKVYVPTVENRLIALKAENGETIWTYRAQSAATIALGLPSPAVDGEVVVAGFGSGELAAIRIADGRSNWTETLASARGGGFSDIAAVSAMPVIADGRVYAVGQGGLAIAIDMRTGRRIWEREVSVAETPWLAGDALFVITTTGNAVCFGRDDGRVRWIKDLGRFADPAKRRNPITWGPPCIAGGRFLACGSHGRMAMLDPVSGESLGEQRLTGPVTLPPAFARGGMLLLSDDADMIWMQGSAPAAG